MKIKYFSPLNAGVVIEQPKMVQNFSREIYYGAEAQMLQKHLCLTFFKGIQWLKMKICVKIIH